MPLRHLKRWNVFLAIFAIIPPAASFNRDLCLRIVRSRLASGSLSPDDEVFNRGKDGLPLSSWSDPVLTFRGCEELCGGGIRWYTDSGPRLNTWVIPVLILISNMDVSPIDKRKYQTILHLLGDPINSLWSLLTKIEVWSRLHHTAAQYRKPSNTVNVGEAKVMGTLLGAMEELSVPAKDPIAVYLQLFRGWDTKRMSSTQLMDVMFDTARKLADSRTDDILRTCLAVILYFWQVISAFIGILGGGDSSPPAGRIATAIFMTWIIPIVLLSNVVGGFVSRRSCFQIIQDFASKIPRKGEDHVAQGYVQDIAPIFGYVDKEDYFVAQAWNGAIYTYRPHKQLFQSSSRNLGSSAFPLVLAALPVIISAVTSYVITHYSPPRGLGCRGVLILVFISAYVASALLTWCFSRLLKPKWHWHWTLAKDAAIAIPGILFIFVSSAGLFGSCRCASTRMLLGERAYVLLNNNPFLERNNKTLYLTVFAVCLVL
ncbi:uncharacterized protein K441DRAFT_609198 [Cenococcum geophilum 1.58]|uniref:uncharacterized protein n=1 Tax=Cenococcum geophilum 1.58 TaxID=794803 RepID=UPI0035901CBC|nr:hypothetical protein K441DRAFT_609198 [Cenococcum geophilum 1.58]